MARSGRCPARGQRLLRAYLWPPMSYLLPVRFLLFISAIAALLAGCCANNVCDCPEQQDAIKLRFSTDTLRAAGKGFKKADLDTLILKRFPLPYDTVNKFETVTLYRTGPTAHDSTIVLDNATPFAQVGTTKLNQYRYVVQYLAHPASWTGIPVRKGVPTTVLTIDKVVLQGSFEGDGCCTCYFNTKKELYRDSANTAIPLETNNAVLISKK